MAAACAATAPAPAAAPDPAYPARQFLDLLRGQAADASLQGPLTRPFGANPKYMPDWNHDGQFGDEPDFAIENSHEPAVAPFRYPCIALDATVTYETVGGGCAPAGTAGARWRTGQARKLRIVDSFGLELAATLFVPDARRRGSRAGVVFADGATAPMQTFYMYSMTLARAGLVVLNFDFASQGQSEQGGGGIWPGSASGPAAGPCLPRRACRETQDVVRWFVGDPIRAVAQAQGTHDPAGNVRNPVLGLLDKRRIGLIGQSMGSLTVSNYLWQLAAGQDADGRALPPVQAAVGLSGFGPASAAVPFQMQTADLDIPGSRLTGTALTDGPLGVKAYYDDLRAGRRGRGALEMIVVESGSHGDTTNAGMTPHAPWSAAVSTAYAADWFGCHLQHRAAACARAARPRPHLSRAVASEQDGDGPAGPQPSRCLVVPSAATLGQALDPPALLRSLAGRPPSDCAR